LDYYDKYTVDKENGIFTNYSRIKEKVDFGEFYFEINAQGRVKLPTNGEVQVYTGLLDGGYLFKAKGFLYCYGLNDDGTIDKEDQENILKIEKTGSELWFRVVGFDESHTAVDWSKISLWKAKKKRYLLMYKIYNSTNQIFTLIF
jgi:hypothetical protein